MFDDENLHILSFFETCSQGKSEISSPSNPKLRPLLDGLSERDVQLSPIICIIEH